MESQSFYTNTEESRNKVPLINDYNNITPSEIKNILAILTEKCNSFTPKKKKTKRKNVNTNPEFIKKSQEIPECIKLQSELNTNPMIQTRKQLHRKNYKRLPSKKNSFSTKHIPRSHEPVCLTLDSSDEEVLSETFLQDCNSTRVKDPVVSKYKKEGNLSMADNETIVLSDSEENDVQFIQTDTHDISEITIDGEDTQTIGRVDKVLSATTSEDDVQSVSTIEEDSVLQTWRASLRKSNVPCVVVSSDEETVYELEPCKSTFCSDDMKTSFVCPVCLQTIINCTHLSSTICGHVFCTNCITKSITNYKKCPTCDNKLKENLVYPVYQSFI